MSLLLCSPTSHFQSPNLSGHPPSRHPSPLNSCKRKRPASPPASPTSSSSSAPRPEAFATGLVIHNGQLLRSSAAPSTRGSAMPNRHKKYLCTWEGCGKSYSKPVRLEEHLRSHTNERPFGCPQCPATYRRDTHLAAHMRMHAPADSKPLACDWTDGTPGAVACGRRFWTRSQLNVHRAGVHEGKGERQFECGACGQTFGKHRLLRAHEAETGCGPGPAPYACAEPGCTLVFPSGSKLRKHARTHDRHRYSCVDAACLGKPIDARSFASWTALQRHTRDAHPPRCDAPGCTRTKPFATVQALNAHRASIHGPASTPRPRPPGPFTCTAHGSCPRSYQSARALQRHVNITHLAPQHTQCTHCSYTSAFPSGIARHMRSQHPDEPRPVKASRVEKITQSALLTGDMSERKYACPVSEISQFEIECSCNVRFNRIYDVQRHLKSEHGLDVEREVVKKYFNET